MSEQDALKEQINDLLSVRSQVGSAHQKLSRGIQRLQEKYNSLIGKQRHVTDHAIVRYLQRVRGIDMDEVRDTIRKCCEEAEEFRNCDGFWHTDGMVLIVNDDGDVVTILGAEQADKYLGRRLMNGKRAGSTATNNGSA